MQKQKKLFAEFEELAKKMGMKILSGKGSFRGDHCVVEESKYIVLNKNRPIEQRLKILASIFATMDIPLDVAGTRLLKAIHAEKEGNLFEIVNQRKKVKDSSTSK